MQLGGLLSALALIGGCWSETLEDGFSQDQWAKLQDQLAPPPVPEQCPGGDRPDHCDALAAFGRKLFFDMKLSEERCPDPLPLRVVEGVRATSTCTTRPGIVSCASCHDPKNWFIDTRVPNYVSQGETAPTKRNSISLVNASMKDHVFTWTGAYTSAGAVLDLALKKAMSSTVADLATTIRDDYSDDYDALWGSAPATDTAIFANVEVAFDAYMRRLVSLNAPFDRYLAGDESSIGESAKRGFAVFVGPGGCFDCHKGPLFSDLSFHNTGVPQLGVSDSGRSEGTFLTPPLRHVAKTAPYMHDGAFTSLGDVIAFYRRGGDDNGFTKDPRLVPLDITDDDALDLEAFLVTLTGDPVPAGQTCAVPPCT